MGKINAINQVSHDLVKIDESELDTALAEIRKHKRRAAEEVYKLGGALKRVRDDELWTLRIDKQTGKGKYDGFWDFCRAEVRISESYVRRLIAINEQFGVKDVKKFGVTRLTVSMRLPEHGRRKFLKRARLVPTASNEFKQIAREIREEPAAPKQYGDPTRTVPVPLGIQWQPMWTRPKDHMSVGQTTTPAHSLADDPWAKFQLTPTVMAYVRLSRNDRGDLMGLLEIRHGKERSSTAGETNVE